MASNTKGSRDAEAAAKDLTEALQAGLASDVRDAAAKTAGFAQLASRQLDPQLAKALIDSASATMELAQTLLSQYPRQRGEAGTASKDAKRGVTSSEAKRDVLDTRARAPNPQHAGEDKCMNPQSTVGSISKKRRTLDTGGGSLSNLKKSKVGTKEAKSSLPFVFAAPVAAAASSAIASTSHPTSSFSFGSVRANLPNGTFVFGSTTAASSAATPSFAGKRKVFDERSAERTMRASEEVLQNRKILKAARSWDKKPSASPIQSGKKPSIFASVKLSPTPGAAATKRDSKAPKGTSHSAPARPAFSFPPPNNSDPAPNNHNNNISTEDDGSPGKANQGDYVEEEVLFEVRAKRHKKAGDKWTKYDAGNLRLYRNKQTSKCGMTIRSDVGNVVFNVGVAEGMEFAKEVKQTKKGTSTYVRFAAVEDPEKGPEVFLLQVKPAFVDKLQQTLEEMAK